MTEGERQEAMRALRLAIVRILPEHHVGAVPQKHVESVIVAMLEEYRRATVTAPLLGAGTLLLDSPPARGSSGASDASADRED